MKKEETMQGPDYTLDYWRNSYYELKKSSEKVVEQKNKEIESRKAHFIKLENKHKRIKKAWITDEEIQTRQIKDLQDQNHKLISEEKHNEKILQTEINQKRTFIRDYEKLLRELQMEKQLVVEKIEQKIEQANRLYHNKIAEYEKHTEIYSTQQPDITGASWKNKVEYEQKIRESLNYIKGMKWALGELKVEFTNN